MDIYSTEEQQAEAIKRFFRENGISLALGVIVGLGGLYGWKAYNQNQITTLWCWEIICVAIMMAID